MKIKFLLNAICFTFILSFNILWLNGQASFDFETGAVQTGYNNVRIPGNQGTLFSMKDDLVPNTDIFYRLRINYTIKKRHTLSVLYAPLEIKSNGKAVNDIVFEGVTFPANTGINGTYKFNSYRLTYRYEIVLKPKFEFGLGFTAKIRDARIALASSGLESEKINVGFVPIINFRLLWKPYENLVSSWKGMHLPHHREGPKTY
ncbi:MAG: hypothetical protein IPJ37_13000 [Bacteroidales bacterium]|nr:hypothetical protein [Bacteroidales bacterium]